MVIGTVLENTLSFLSNESHENEIQKNVFLKMRRVRDKIASVTRKYDLAVRQRSQSESVQNDRQNERIRAYETELDQLELQLDVMLESESERQEKVIALHAAWQDANDDDRTTPTLPDDATPTLPDDAGAKELEGHQEDENLGMLLLASSSSSSSSSIECVTAGTYTSVPARNNVATNGGGASCVSRVLSHAN